MVSTDSLSSATLNVEALTQLQAAIHALTLSINYAVGKYSIDPLINLDAAVFLMNLSDSHRHFRAG